MSITPQKIRSKMKKLIPEFKTKRNVRVTNKYNRYAFKRTTVKKERILKLE